ncbi:MAG: diguanylate cyclase [Campylobacterales bacterium]|nr:diguanylate cyclase [Campylobacterales bacterium]
MTYKNENLSLNAFELTIFEHSYSSVVITTAQLEGDHPKIIYINDAFTKMTGYSKEDILGKTPRILQGEKTDKNVLKELKECLLNNRFFEGKAINYTKDAKEYWVEWNISPVYDDDKNLVAFISIQKDVSIAEKLLNHIKLFQKAINQNHDSIALFNAKGEYIYINETYAKRSKYTSEQLLGETAHLLKSGQHTEAFYDDLWEKLLSKKSFETVFCNKDAHGDIYYEKQAITPIVEEDKLIGFVSIGKDYDLEEQNKEQLQKDVYVDALTKLFNRKMLDLKLDAAIKRYEESGEHFCMMFLDIDNFKTVNDTLGHDEGDLALISTANFLKQTLRKSDDVFRHGGDEFIILLYGAKEEDAHILSQKIEDAFQTSLIPDKYPIGLSIGFGQYHGESINEFFKQTDKKMYAKKRENKLKKQ